MRPTRELIWLLLLVALAAYHIGRRSRAADRGPGPVPSAGTVPLPPVIRPAVTLQADARDVPVERDDVLIRATLQSALPGTYLDAMLREGNSFLTRWPDRRLDALRIAIDDAPEVPGWDRSYATAAARAFEEWRLAGFPVALDVVLDTAGADIRIVWTERFSAATDQIGVTRAIRDSHGWLRSAEITVATHDRNGRSLRAATIFGVVRHEVGHALGLGHSPNPEDVMFPYSRASDISAADRATLHLLYKLPPGALK